MCGGKEGGKGKGPALFFMKGGGKLGKCGLMPCVSLASRAAEAAMFSEVRAMGRGSRGCGCRICSIMLSLASWPLAPSTSLGQ